MPKTKAYTKEQKATMLKVLVYSRVYGNSNRPRVTEHFPVEQRAEAEAWGDRVAKHHKGRYEIREPKPVIDRASVLGGLIATLTEQTQDLRVEYVTKTKEWAAGEYDRTEQMLPRAIKLRDDVARAYSDHQRAQRDVPQAERKQYKHPRLGRPYHDSEWYEHEHSINKARKILERGKDAFIEQARVDAELHYTISIEKLADRVMKKGLDLTKLTVKTGKVKQNIETVLTDGTLTVFARTILAYGPIVRPHYRYIIT